MSDKNENLMEGLQRELNRNREILGYYDEIPQGRFGAHSIREKIKRGEQAINNNDVVEMTKAFTELQETN